MPATTRSCPHPDHDGLRTLPFTSEFFYIRPSGDADYWCRDCVRRYNREQRARGGRKFGVEIEFIGNRYELETQLLARGLSVHNAHYTHQVMRQWKIVTDASVYNGYELVSPPLKGRRGLAELEKACAALAAAGATVNSACGLHVHHDVSDLNGRAFTRLFRAWSNNQQHTDMLVARSRRGSRWARPLESREVAHAARLAPDANSAAIRNHFTYADRYRSLNVACFARYGTVEVRQHQGTINFKKIAAWIAYGQAFITLAKSSNGSTDAAADPFALIDRLAADAALPAAKATYLKGRAAHFSGRRPVAA